MVGILGYQYQCVKVVLPISPLWGAAYKVDTLPLRHSHPLRFNEYKDVRTSSVSDVMISIH